MNNIKVLVVENERIVADDIKFTLKRLGYVVSGIALSGEEAVKKAEEIHPDLVLMDIVLEGKMDGTEAASAISSRFNIPVVYLTAYADDKTLERAKITNPFGFILKPFEDRELYSAIEMALYHYKVGNMLKESEERYRSVVENAHDAIYIISQDGFQYVNPAFKKLTGWKKEELGNKKFNFLNIIHPGDKKIIKESKKTNNKRQEALRRSEFRIITKDGAERMVEANTVNIGKNGEVKEIGIIRDITERKQAEEERKQSFERLRKNLEETVHALASAVEMRDPYTAGHQQRVTHLACAIAREIGLSTDQVDGIHMAGVVHDIGKILIPSEILSKPGRLTEIDYSMIETHPNVGYDILKTIEFPYPVAQIVLQHHERMDGSGYPAGLSGEDILMEARILAVSDVVEAIAKRRPYRAALGLNKALKEISKNKGILYYVEAVEACLKLFEEKTFSFRIKSEHRVHSL
ncbi:MAG: HD domain-containing phosphohydrolase [Candidatus Aminicenantaceae bacterium]